MYQIPSSQDKSGPRRTTRYFVQSKIFAPCLTLTARPVSVYFEMLWAVVGGGAVIPTSDQSVST